MGLLGVNTSDEIGDLASLFPNQARHDPALFQMVDRKLFTDPKARRRFHPLDKKRRAIEDEFFCTQVNFRDEESIIYGP